MVALIWLRYPGNHGAGPEMFRWFFGIHLLAGAWYWISTSRPALLAIACAVLGLGATWIADHRNIIVDYDEWLRRGMPQWGEALPSKGGS